MKKLFSVSKSKSLLVFSFVAACFGLVSAASAAPTTTPEEVLETMVDTPIDKLIYWIGYVMSNYFEYIIVFAIGVALFFYFRRFMRIGTR